jgi:hypothetical protein
MKLSNLVQLQLGQVFRLVIAIGVSLGAGLPLLQLENRGSFDSSALGQQIKGNDLKTSEHRQVRGAKTLPFLFACGDYTISMISVT